MAKKYYIDTNHLTEFDNIAIEEYIAVHGGTVEEAIEAINAETKSMSKKRVEELETEASKDAELSDEDIAEIDAICKAGNEGLVY